MVHWNSLYHNVVHLIGIHRWILVVALHLLAFFRNLHTLNNLLIFLKTTTSILGYGTFMNNM